MNAVPSRATATDGALPGESSVAGSQPACAGWAATPATTSAIQSVVFHPIIAADYRGGDDPLTIGTQPRT